jgi:hypothetical protein
VVVNRIDAVPGWSRGDAMGTPAVGRMRCAEGPPN